MDDAAGIGNSNFSADAIFTGGAVSMWPSHQRREDRKRSRPCGDEEAPKNNPQPLTTAAG